LIYYQRKNKIILFSALWVFFGFLPLWHNMFTRLTLEGNRLNMAESWVYLPGIGFCMIAAYFLTKISTKFIFYALFVSVMLFYGSITYAQQKYWIDPLVFYKHNLKFSPHHDVLWGHLTTALAEHKYYAEAQKEAEKFIAYYPDNAGGYNRLGIIYFELGLYDKAKAQLNKSLKISPFQLWTRNALYALGSENEKANVLIYPDDSTKLSSQDKALYYLNKGDLVGAIDACKQALKEEPTARNYVIAGIVLLEGGKLKNAINAFKTALNLEPQNLGALINLSRCYRMLNMMKEVSQLEAEIQRIKEK
jgi:tetratricopeptide (TPR) repeat protein